MEVEISMKVQVVLPTLNEEESVQKTIKEVLFYLNPVERDNQILVIDGGSTDRTVEIAKTTGAKIIVDTNPGKGSAFKAALEYLEAPYIFMVDADFTYSLECLPRVLQILKEERDTVVVCPRKYKLKGSMSVLHKVGNTGLTVIANLLYRTHISDLCSGFWGFRLENLREFNIVSTGFTLEADLFSNTIMKNLRLREVPTTYRPRIVSTKSKLKLTAGLSILRLLLIRRIGLV